MITAPLGLLLALMALFASGAAILGVFVTALVLGGRR